MSNQLALDKLRAACCSPPAADCPDALDALRSLELQAVAERELREGREQHLRQGRDMPEPLRRAADNPALFRGYCKLLLALEAFQAVADLPLHTLNTCRDVSEACLVTMTPASMAQALAGSPLAANLPGAALEPMSVLPVLVFLGINPHHRVDALAARQFQEASSAIDALFGSHSRQAARAQLARNGLVPSLPAAGGQAAQQQPTPVAQLNAAAAALQADLAAFLPGVSLDDLMCSALMLRLIATVHMIPNLPRERHAALLPQALTDCQMLLNRYAASGRSLLVARRVTLLTARSPAHKNNVRELLLVRLVQLLHQAAERSEADKRWYAAALLNENCASMLVILQLYYSEGLLQLRAGRQLGLGLGSAQQVAQQVQQLLAHSRSFRRRIKPWALNACLQQLTAAPHTRQLPTEEPPPAEPRSMRCDACKLISLHLRNCSKCRAVSYCSEECQARHWREGGHRLECRILAAQQQQDS